jgi:hypothetical protein
MSKIVVTKKFYELQNLISPLENQQGTFGGYQKEETDLFSNYD